MRVGNCPSCGAPVDFAPGAGKVKVCPYCGTVVLRGEANLESLGKVAELADTESPLKLGLSGSFKGRGFSVVGRLQKANGTGTWDEWCLSFDDGREAWLAESEGAWRLLEPFPAERLPDVESLHPLELIAIGGKRLVVEEVGEADVASAEGQLPSFNKHHHYADATGVGGLFCSLDSADGEVEAYLGQQVTLAALGFDAAELQPTPRRVALSQARCPHCNGPLDLKAPDATRRVGCPYCGALVEVDHGRLEFLKLLDRPDHEPLLPLGAQGSLFGVRWTVLAFLVRSCRVEDVDYPWDEYLLWNSKAGFRWLMCSNGHWTFLTPVPAGEVVTFSKAANHEGLTFRLFQHVFVRTRYVVGECYWQVEEGESAEATEWVDPPRSLNLDRTASEASYTRGELLERDVVAQAFGLRQALPRPTGLAPAQVNPSTALARDAWVWAGVWGAALLAVGLLFLLVATDATYFSGRFSVPPGTTPGSPETIRFSEPFQVSREVPLAVELSVPSLSNGWLGANVDLVNEATGEVVAVYAEAEYYFGVEGGERWSEGSPNTARITSPVDPGTYVVRVTPQFNPGPPPPDFLVTVKSHDGPSLLGFLLTLALLLVVPLFHQVRSSGFETRRWNEAVLQSAPNVSTFPYAKDDDE